jgi:hypothetical protein
MVNKLLCYILHKMQKQKFKNKTIAAIKCYLWLTLSLSKNVLQCYRFLRQIHQQLRYQARHTEIIFRCNFNIRIISICFEGYAWYHEGKWAEDWCTLCFVDFLEVYYQCYTYCLIWYNWRFEFLVIESYDLYSINLHI